MEWNKISLMHFQCFLFFVIEYSVFVVWCMRVIHFSLVFFLFILLCRFLICPTPGGDQLHTAYPCSHLLRTTTDLNVIVRRQSDTSLIKWHGGKATVLYIYYIQINRLVHDTLYVELRVLLGWGGYNIELAGGALYTLSVHLQKVYRIRM